MRYVLLLSMTLLLGACETVVSEREGVFEFRGNTYRALTREYARGDVTFERRIVLVGSRRVSCSAVDDRDCAVAIQTERRSSR